MQKSIVFILFFCFITIHCIAQKNKDILILYKKDWSQTKDIESAEYLMHEVVENDTTYICRFYQIYGPMIQMETYRDAELEIKHGPFAWYNRIGDLDSMGCYYFGKKDKIWDYGLDDSNHYKRSEEYENGVFKKIIHYTKAETPPQLKVGGVQGWEKFLFGNLKMTDRYLKLAGTLRNNKVSSEFEIDVEGKVSAVCILHSCEWSIDMESIRVIKKSPLWNPAISNGVKIPFRYRQNITFTRGQ